ncbi:MAG: hypothetical protein H6857_02990 [Rhodospirillales bacterium]|nr:hypothetical protein [Rhodospirillales bacterium]
MSGQDAIKLTPQEKARYTRWLRRAYEAARDFDGSEASDNALYEPLGHLDAFVQDRNGGKLSDDLSTLS